jgi:hypothetical protein
MTLPQPVRLEAITAAVMHCQYMKSIGAPVGSWSPALKQPVFHLWEVPEGTGGKGGVAQAHSLAAETTSGDVVYEHSYPFKYLRDELLHLERPTPETVRAVLSSPLHGHVAMITKEEDQELSKKGFQSKMPDDWDGVNPLARYEAIGLTMVPGPLLRPCGCQCGVTVKYKSKFQPGHDAKLVSKVVGGELPPSSLDGHPKLMAKYKLAEKAAQDRIWNDNGVGLVIQHTDGTIQVLK